MLRTIGLLSLGIALVLGGPSSAAESGAAADCGPGTRPVVSEGLPQRPCAGAATGVIVHRGPAVAPEPSARAPEAPARRIYRVRTARPPSHGGSRASYHAIPFYPVPYLGYPAAYFRLVIDSGDVRLVIGRGYPPLRPVRPHPRHPHAHPAHPRPPRKGGPASAW